MFFHESLKSNPEMFIQNGLYKGKIRNGALAHDRNLENSI